METVDPRPACVSDWFRGLMLALSSISLGVTLSCQDFDDSEIPYEVKDIDPPELRVHGLTELSVPSGEWELRYSIRDVDKYPEVQLQLDEPFNLAEQRLDSIIRFDSAKQAGDTAIRYFNLARFGGRHNLYLRATDGVNENIDTLTLETRQFMRCHKATPYFNPIDGWRFVATPGGSIWGKSNYLNVPIQKIDPRSLEWVPTSAFPNQYKQESISLAVDASGLLWTCYRDSAGLRFELVRFDEEKIHERHSLPEIKWTAAGDTIVALDPFVGTLSFDSAGTLWGTWGEQLQLKGYFHYDPQAKRWEVFHEAGIKAVWVDKNSQVWKQTHNEVFQWRGNEWKPEGLGLPPRGILELGSNRQVMYRDSSYRLASWHWFGAWEETLVPGTDWKAFNSVSRSANEMWVLSYHLPDSLEAGMVYERLVLVKDGIITQRFRTPAYLSALHLQGDTLYVLTDKGACMVREEGL